MARKLGTYPLSSNIEIEAGAPLDARTIVPLKADLTRAGSFSYPYVGMEVFVTEELQKYRLIGTNPELTDNWTKTDKGVVDGYYDAEHGGFYKDQGFTKPITGTSEVLYIDKSTDNVYRWNGSAFAQINPIDSQVPTIDMADERENIAQNDDVATIMGKIAKYFDDLGEVAFSDDYDDLDNTPTKLSEFENDPGYITDEGIVTSVKIGNTSYDPVEGIVSLPQYPDISGKADKATTLAGYGITDAKIANGTITLGSNTITPVTDISGKADKATTLAGYGITDAKIANGTITLGSNTITPVTDVSGKADKATTLAGYGITDAKIANGTITLGANTITPLTQHQDISGKADKATTLAGYGITDAKIANGTITLGANTITPLTQHQDISGKADKATTLAGYGITDAKIANGTITLGANTITPVTDVSGKADKSATVSTVTWSSNKLTKTINGTTTDVVTAATILGNLTSTQVVSALGYTPYDSSNPSGYTSNIGTVTGVKMNGTTKSPTSGIVDLGTVITSHQDISGKADKATTLAGYGITDAKIANGVITLGTNTITPLTSHQSVTDNNPTLSWGTKSKVATIGSTAINVTMPSNPNTDTKVTSVGNHYAPAEDSTAQLDADASSSTAATWNSTSLVTGVTVKRDAKGHVTGLAVDSIKMPANPNTNTTYTFEGGTNKFTVTPSGGTAQDITITPSITNNITGSGTSGYLAKFRGASTITSGPQLGSSTTTYLRNDGSWATPTDTKNTAGSTDTSSKIFLIGATSQAANPQTYSQDTAYVGTDGCLYSGGTKVLTSQDISGKADKATTIAGYGITDAYINNNSVTLGSKTLIPVLYTGNLTGTIGSGSPAADTKTYWENDTNIPINRVSIGYNTSGDEYSFLFSKGGSNSYGSVVKYGYADRYLYILRRSGGTWQSTDWEKTYAGYADSAGSCASATKATQDGDGNTISSTYMKKGVDYVTAGQKSGTTLGVSATAEGSNTTASGEYSHVEGLNTTAAGHRSHAEGWFSTVTSTGVAAHAEGESTEASNTAAHAEGYVTVASGYYSHAEGRSTIAASTAQHVEGKYNVEDANDTYAHIIGGGSSSTRKNILTVDWSGQLTSAADLVFSSKPLRAVGSRQAAATNPKDLLNELRFSSGCMGSYSQSSSYTKGSVTLAAGWYNYIWIPHRFGGVNWTANQDNCNYGTCILCGMTMDAFAVLRLSGGDVGSVHKWY